MKLTFENIRKTTRKSGIYLIQGPNGRVYIGQSYNVGRRLTVHLSQLIAGKHGNVILQRSWLKNGSDAFEFRVLMEVERSMLTRMEQYWMDQFKIQGKLYNLHPTAGSALGFKQPESQKSKVRAALIGRPLDPEAVAKMRATLTGRTLTTEHKEAIGRGGRGLKKSASHRAKIGAAHVGMKRTAETCANISKAVRAAMADPEVRAKISKAARNRGCDAGQSRLSPR
jgi:group I intron endonuclease